MANLIVITGPQAVGKMTVAKELQKMIDYKLMTNHDSIELSLKIFKDNKKVQKELIKSIRSDVFKLSIKNDIDMIFTFVTAFDNKEDIKYIKKLQQMYKKSGGEFYFVELYSDIKTRLERNVTPSRLEEKPSKRDIKWSNNELVEGAKKHKLNSDKDKYLFTSHLKIDNNDLSPREVANIIVDSYKL